MASLLSTSTNSSKKQFKILRSIYVESRLSEYLTIEFLLKSTVLGKFFLDLAEYGGRDHGDGIIIVLYGRRSSLVPNPSIRKKRSFNRQPSQLGRGKQPIFLQALAAERDTAEEQNAIQKVEEAKASANRSVELAVQSRRRAQLLMNNADLATYRAAMALRIAEGALVCESSDTAATHLFLD